jgi:hypothetical protein
VIPKQTTQFRDRVRARDGRCVVTGDPRVDPDYTGLAAAHIFPVAHADLVYFSASFIYSLSMVID